MHAVRGKANKHKQTYIKTFSKIITFPQPTQNV